MFVVFLKFSDNKEKASQFMEDHKSWIKKGFDDGIFLLAGSLPSNSGGTVLAHQISLDALIDRVKQDPFVQENIVQQEIIAITPSKLDERLAFLATT